MRAAPPIICAFLLALVCGCGRGGDGAPVQVVATTTQVADLVRNVAGERASVDSILRPNSDPHDYEPRPSDAAAVAQADVVFRSGGDLDGWLDDVLDSAGGDAERVTLIDSVRRDGDDPHWWQDPRNAILAVRAIRDALIEADPNGRAGYERRAAAYTDRLRALDARGRALPRPRSRGAAQARHDPRRARLLRAPLRHRGDRRGDPVALDPGPAVRQGRERARRPDRARARARRSSPRRRCRGSSSRRSRARRAREVGGELWADTLGPEGSSGATYVDSIRSNARTLADGMSGGRVTCELS